MKRVSSPRQRTLRRSKAAERRLAAIVGGRRNPAVGKGYPDVETPTHAFQHKLMGTPPGWLLEMWEQALSDGAAVNKNPVLVLEFPDHGGNLRLYIQSEAGWILDHGSTAGLD